MDELKKEIRAFLKKNKYGVLATCGTDQPRATPVMYQADDELNVYIYSEKFTTKFKLLKKNPKVSFAVHNTRRPLKGLQLWGTAEVIAAGDPRHDEHLPEQAQKDPKLKAACKVLHLIKITASKIVLLKQGRAGGPYVVLTRTKNGRETVREVKNVRDLK